MRHVALARHRVVGRGEGRVGRGGGGSAGNETPGQLGTAGTAAFGIPLPVLAPRRDGHGHHGHATPTLGQSVGQEGRGRLTGRDRGGGDAWESLPGRCDRGCRQRPGLCCRLPPRRGPGAKGRAARPSQKETAPNKAPVRLEQLVPAHQPPTGPGNTSRPRGRAPAPAPAAQRRHGPVRLQPPAPALGTAMGGIQTAWGTPPATCGALAVSPGDPWDPALAKAAGCGNSLCLRHGTVAGNVPLPLPGSFPVAPAMSGYSWPRAGDTGGGRVSAAPGHLRARSATGPAERCRRRGEGAAGGPGGGSWGSAATGNSRPQ